MIEHASYNDGRTLTIITKLNEVIDEVNSLRRDFEAMALNFDNHTHVTIPVDGGIITDGPYQTGGPLVAMIDERQEG